MKKYIFFLLVVIFTFTVVSAQTIKKVKIDEVVKMVDTSTTPIIINFWASWCKPCVHEIPYFEKQVAAYRDKKIKLVLVSLDFQEDYPKALQAFVKKNNYVSTVVWLSDTNADIFCPKIDLTWSGAIPATLMVNNQKNYRQFYGFQLTEARLALELKHLID